MVHHTDEESRESLELSWRAMEEAVDSGQARRLGLRADPLYWDIAGNVAGIGESCAFYQWCRHKPSAAFFESGSYGIIASLHRRDPKLWGSILVLTGGVNGWQAYEPLLKAEPSLRATEERAGGMRFVFMAWCLCWSDAIFAQSTNPEHVRQNVQAAQLTLTLQELDCIQRAFSSQSGNALEEKEAIPLTIGPRCSGFVPPPGGTVQPARASAAGHPPRDEL